MKIPGLKWLTILVAVYAIVWISLEGKLWQALLLSAGIVLLVAGYIAQRFLGGKRLSSKKWVGVVAIGGLLMGSGLAITEDLED